ncbi:MAG TPA: 3'(2'),5'-bisphosphate nucleotidase [Isosphaeraceae bacterium]|jgi:3'(2'), 5'-bisphosphate nucleotidase
MDAGYEREREVAIRAVRAAAGLCRSVGAPAAAGVLDKADRSPVTVADFGSQALICQALAEAFPADPVIAEEDSAALRLPENAVLRDRVLRSVRAARPDADAADLLRWIDHGAAAFAPGRSWTLDPIDGTKGFLRGEQYAVALALIVGGRVAVAAMACPNLPAEAGAVARIGAIFVAVRGRGAGVLPLDGHGDILPIRVSLRDDPASARFCESVEAGHSAHGEAAEVAARLGIAAPAVRLDSQAKYAIVARGEAEIYLRLPTRADYREKIWDHAAGVLIVEEAGGVVTDVAGRPLEFTHGRELTANRGVIVTNGRLHDRVLAALNAPDRLRP